MRRALRAFGWLHRGRGAPAPRGEDAAFRASYELAAIGKARISLDGRFLAVNRALCALIGQPEDELVGRRIAEVTHPADRAADAIELERVLRGQAPTLTREKRFVRPDGEARWAFVSAAMIRDAAGAPDHLIADVLDVTDRRRVEEALRASEARLRLGAEVAGFGAFEWDIAADRHDWSPEVRRIYGVPPDQPLAIAGIMALVHPDDRQRNAADVDAALSPLGTGEIDSSFRIIRPDGAVRAIAILARATHEGAGTARRAVRLVGVVQDVTEKRAAAEALRAAERRQRFLLALEDRLRGLQDPHAVKLAAAETLGRELGADRVAYTEIDEEAGVGRVRRAWTGGALPDNTGAAGPLAAFGRMMDVLRAGQALISPDVPNDPRLSGAADGFARATGVRATLDTPLVKAGRLVAVLNVNHATPRAWTAEEAELARAVAERTWAAVERALAEARLRDREERLRFVVANSPDNIFLQDQDLRYTWVAHASPPFDDAAVLGRTDRELMERPEDADRLEAIKHRVLARGERVEAELTLTLGGRPRRFHAIYEPWRDAAGAVAGVLGYSRDITTLAPATAPAPAPGDPARTVLPFPQRSRAAD